MPRLLSRVTDQADLNWIVRKAAPRGAVAAVACGARSGIPERTAPNVENVQILETSASVDASHEIIKIDLSTVWVENRCHESCNPDPLQRRCRR